MITENKKNENILQNVDKNIKKSIELTNEHITKINELELKY